MTAYAAIIGESVGSYGIEKEVHSIKQAGVFSGDSRLSIHTG